VHIVSPRSGRYLAKDRVTVGAPISRFSPSRWQGPSFLASGRGSKGQSPRLIGLRARLRFLGRGQPAPSPLATGLGSAVSSPSGGRGGAPATKMFSYILEVPRGPFRNLLGAKFGGGGAWPPCPPLNPPMVGARVKYSGQVSAVVGM